MARRVDIILTDDIDGSDASETLAFGLDGSAYEIDLSGENAAKLREALQPYLSVARKVANRAKSATPRRRATSSDATEIRAWAQEHGIAVSSRGRVAGSVRDAFEAAH
jgi:hypothetical protein